MVDGLTADSPRDRLSVMSFREYLRWDGGVGIVIGAALLAFGLRSGHQSAVDAVIGGMILIAGTGVFMRLRHNVPLRRPGTWFTSAPLARAEPDGPSSARPLVLARLVAEAVLLAVTVVGLSYLTGYWLTYMDMGVWAVAIGAIKIGPARTAVAEHEERLRRSWRIAGPPLRRVVVLTVCELPASGRKGQA
jgi:hypothetical protein